MGKRSRPPGGPIVVRTYADLNQFVQAFARGSLNLMVLSGGPGLGKTRQLQAALGSEACKIEGHTTAFGMYLRLFADRDQPVLIDDVDSLHKDRNAVRLLKSLCQSETVKTLSWNSDARSLAKTNTPSQFTTSSRVAIVTNHWESLDLDVAALEDRGHVIHFEPSPCEVHRQVATWFGDQVVFDFIGDHLSLITQPSFRHYLLAAELKDAGLDWKSLILARFTSDTLLVVAQLKASDQFANEKQRVQAFVAAGHGCRATYFNLAKKLPAKLDIPRLELKPPAPEVQAPLADLLALLKARHGNLGSG